MAGKKPVCICVEAELMFLGRSVPHSLDRLPLGSLVMTNGGATMLSFMALQSRGAH